MNILIVDDNQTNVMLLKHLVMRLGDCRPATFLASPEALAWADENQADIVLVDNMMPDLDGAEFIRRFRKRAGNQDVPIVMITTADAKDIRLQALDAGATDFLGKPVDPAEFTARLRNLLSLRRHQNEARDRAVWLTGTVEQATRDVVAREEELILRLSRAAEFRDPETGNHIRRMAHYSRLIAEGLGLAPEEVTHIHRAAPMHDIGKIGVPDHILCKPGRLDPDEMAIMHGHPRIGWEILKNSDSALIAMGADIALTHHEKWDGTGYPDRLAGTAIPLPGRIVAVADVFDALISVRPYKLAWSVERARSLLAEQAGRHFDPACVDAMFAVWDRVLEIRERFKDEVPHDRSAV
ncbi:HD-GYP domain-containing protein [Azospirillum doebereinerae]|uniref:HD-GYP domain-containing protein n=1 Tax=Azospirillum doebereinerae TaxID=92933 RepID=UPI001EE5D739|nr:response regulator [Azospirillum doebereinerae]